MKTSIALLVASSAGSVSILNMEDTLNSEIHFGNAVVSAHCKADETKSLVGITTADNQQLSTAQHEHDFPDTVKAHLTGVATSCNGLLGTKPCASSAAKKNSDCSKGTVGSASPCTRRIGGSSGDA